MRRFRHFRHTHHWITGDRCLGSDYEATWRGINNRGSQPKMVEKAAEKQAEKSRLELLHRRGRAVHAWPSIRPRACIILAPGGLSIRWIEPALQSRQLRLPTGSKGRLKAKPGAWRAPGLLGTARLTLILFHRRNARDGSSASTPRCGPCRQADPSRRRS
jgi:hypothetical protein